MISVGCDDLSVTFGDEVLFDKVSFSIEDGDKLGIVGPNGAGKSTLFKIIVGITEPDSGNVYISKDKTVGYLSQNPEIESENTLYDEMLLAFQHLVLEENELESLREKAESGDEDSAVKYASRYEKFIENGGLQYKGRSRSVLLNLGFSEADMNLPIQKLSGGQKTKVALAKILLTEPDIIMLDEPTNHLDIENIEWLEKFILSTKKTVLLISHDRFFLCRTTNKTLELELGSAKLYNGNYDAYIAAKKRENEILEHQYKNQQKEIARLESIIEQQRRWGREKNIAKAESTQKRLDRIERISPVKAPPQNIRLKFDVSTESGNDVLKTKMLSKKYSDKYLFTDVDLEIKKNDRVIITGPNGCGKSTLLKIIYGTVPPTQGRVEPGFNVKEGYYDQEHHGLNDDNTVIDELWSDYDDLSQTKIRTILSLFLFKGDDVFKKVSVLSGGEKARLALAKLMLSDVNFLLLDEPTNHLDIASREILEDALMSYEGTVLAVSHDRYFINKMATRMIVYENRTFVPFNGTYSEYTEYREKKLFTSTSAEECRDEQLSDSKARFMASKQAAALKRKKEKRYEKLVEDIKNAEDALEKNNIAWKTTDGTDYVRLSEIYEQNTALEESLLEMWEELEKLKIEMAKSDEK